MAFKSDVVVGVKVVGADAASKDMARLAAEEKNVEKSAEGAARAALVQEKALVRQKIAAQEASKALVDEVKAENSRRKAFEDALVPTQEMAKATSALGKAGELAGSGLSLLRKAAELIPGMELGTIFAAAAGGVYALYKAFGDTTDAATNQTNALRVQEVAVRDLIRANNDLLKSQLGAGASTAKKAIENIGAGITPEAMDQVIRLGAQRDQIAKERDELISRKVREVGGLSPVSDSEQKRIESLQAERNKIIEAAEKRNEDGSYSENYKSRKALLDIALQFQKGIEQIRRTAETKVNWKLNEELDDATKKLENIDKQLKGLGASEPASPAVRATEKMQEEARKDLKDTEKARKDYDEAMRLWRKSPERDTTRRMMEEADKRSIYRSQGTAQIQNGGSWMILGIPQEQPAQSNPRDRSNAKAAQQMSELYQKDVEALYSLDRVAKDKLLNRIRELGLSGDFEGLAKPIEDVRKIKEAKAAPPSWGMYTPGKDSVQNVEAMAKTMQSTAGTIGTAFMSMADPISSGLNMVTDSVGQLTGQLGIAMTNMFLAGESSQKSAKRIAGEMTAGLSAQAFSYAVLFGAMAVAFALMPPPFDVYAVPAGIGAGVMAGAGAALAVTARALGAEPVGGAAKKGSSSAGKSSGSGTSLSSPYKPDVGETKVTVIIGGEVVTRGVKTETRRQNLRGGITEGRMAMAT